MFSTSNRLIFIIFVIFVSLNANAQKTKLRIGDKIPNFSLLDQYGREFISEKYLGKQPLVIFFYPEDNSPICTRQVVAFRDNYKLFENLNAKIIGINPESLISHREFTIKNKIPFTILRDRNNRVQKLFGVPSIENSKPKRYTFIFDTKGKLRDVFFSMEDVDAHINESIRVLNVEYEEIKQFEKLKKIEALKKKELEKSNKDGSEKDTNAKSISKDSIVNISNNKNK
jgi:peroxiredoxin Q/BCP